MLSFLLDFIAPRTCTECGRFGSWLCESCYERFEYFTQPIFLNLHPLYLDELRVMAVYHPPLPTLLHALKYQSVKGIGVLLADLMFETTTIPDCDYVAAIPLHPRRQDERGFNQAKVIAQRLASHLHKPLLSVLRRRHHLTAQASIKDREKRLHRLENAFEATGPLPHQIASHILLIDDVTTTGSTLNECARMLKQMGWKKVSGLTVAHGQ